MPRFDLPPDELRVFRPAVAEPHDFDSFWTSTLAEARALALPPRATRTDSPINSFEIYDVEFSGFGGDLIRGWFILPAGTEGALTTIVQYGGYESRHRRPGAVRVCSGAPRARSAALNSGVHEKVRVPGSRPENALVGQPAAAVI